MLRTHALVYSLASLSLLAITGTGCKKSSGPGGGGGSWLVGEAGLMVNADGDKPLGTYDLGIDTDLNAIACRYEGEAWVVGNDATLLYTDDGGASWEAQSVPTAAHLRAVATQDYGGVFVAGNGTFLVTRDTGTTWQELGDGVTQFRSVSTAYASPRVLALADDGGLWSYNAGVLARRTTLSGARAVQQSVRGDLVIAAGNGIRRSLDGGASWQELAVDPAIRFDDVSVLLDGTAVAVGEHGAIANIAVDGTVTLQASGDASLHTIHIHHDATGYAAGEDGRILLTYDRGLTWQEGPVAQRTVRGVDEIGFGHR